MDREREVGKDQAEEGLGSTINSVTTDDFSPPWVDTIQRQHSPDLHTLPGETLKLFCPQNLPSRSGKAELHSQLVPPTTACCLCFPAGEQIPGVKADTTGCGMGVGIAALPQPGFCNIAQAACAIQREQRARARAANAGSGGKRLTDEVVLRWRRTWRSTWNYPHCRTECLTLLDLSYKNKLTSCMF